MTKEEVLKRIKELEEYIKKLDNKIGHKDDEIFLLSVDEYEKYKEVIPQIKCWWWLRSFGETHNRATCVYEDGTVNYCGGNVYIGNICTRPALKIPNATTSIFQVGNKFIWCGYTWIYLGDNLAISEMPIMFTRFDEKSNDYETSEIRKKLLEWYEERKDYNRSI